MLMVLQTELTLPHQAAGPGPHLNPATHARHPGVGGGTRPQEVEWQGPENVSARPVHEGGGGGNGGGVGIPQRPECHGVKAGSCACSRASRVSLSCSMHLLQRVCSMMTMQRHVTSQARGQDETGVQGSKASSS